MRFNRWRNERQHVPLVLAGFLPCDAQRGCPAPADHPTPCLSPDSTDSEPRRLLWIGLTRQSQRIVRFVRGDRTFAREQATGRLPWWSAPRKVRAVVVGAHKSRFRANRSARR